MPGQTQQEFTVGQTKVSNAYGHSKDFAIVLDKDVRVPMRDGIGLYANVFRPKAPGKYPVIFYISPKIKDRFPAFEEYERIPNTGVIRVSVYAAFEAPDPVYREQSRFGRIRGRNVRASRTANGG